MILECLAFIFSIEPVVSVVYFAITLILYGNYLLLGAAKDLGKKVSISLVSFNLIAQIIGFIRSVFQFISMSDLVLTTVGMFSAGICLIMTIVKYKDKATRNSI